MCAARPAPGIVVIHFFPMVDLKLLSVIGFGMLGQESMAIRTMNHTYKGYKDLNDYWMGLNT